MTQLKNMFDGTLFAMHLGIFKSYIVVCDANKVNLCTYVYWCTIPLLYIGRVHLSF